MSLSLLPCRVGDGADGDMHGVPFIDVISHDPDSTSMMETFKTHLKVVLRPLKAKAQRCCLSNQCNPCAPLLGMLPQRTTHATHACATHTRVNSLCYNFNDLQSISSVSQNGGNGVERGYLAVSVLALGSLCQHHLLCHL